MFNAILMLMDGLNQFGWTDEFLRKWQMLDVPGTLPGRVTADFGTSLRIAMPATVHAELSGKLAHYVSRDKTPKVGDWVAARMLPDGNAIVEAVLPRRSEVARRAAGRRAVKQVMAANVDVAFVLLALDNDFSPERLKRFLYQLSISDIKPVIVLNKGDKVEDTTAYLEALQDLQLPIVVATATEGEGVAEILSYIGPGQSAMLLGSSGVGKSTLTNRLLGRQVQATQTVRESDDTGRHTTVHRELFMLPNGGLLIDTPGIRELQLWGSEEDLNQDFDDVARLISQCNYSTCRHSNEPGCAIRAALRGGQLSRSHYTDYLKMNSELGTLQARKTEQERSANKKSRKHMDRQARDMLNDDY